MVWWVNINKPPSATGGRFLTEFGLKTWWWQFRWESNATCGVITKGASRRSNFVWSAWPLDQYPKSWSILPPTEWIGSMYLAVVKKVVITLYK